MDIYAFMEQESIPRLSLPDIDMRDTLAFQNSLSSGVNKLPLPRVYHDLLRQEMIEQQMIKNYTQTTGTPVLAESIKLYEKMNTLSDPKQDNTIFEHICITAGATASIVFFSDIMLSNTKCRRFCC